MIDTVLFDCWGTLLQAPSLMTRGATIEYFYKYFKSNAQDIEYEVFKEKYIEIAKKQHKDAMKDYRELDYVYRLESTLRALGFNADKRSELARKVWSGYLSEWPKQSTPYSETSGVLSSLRGRYKLGLVTNFPDGSTARQVFNKFDFSSIFDSIVVSGDVGFRKPNRLLFDVALSQLNSAPEFAVMIGDTFEADVLGARGAGIKSVLIDADDSQAENHQRSDAVVKGIGEVETILSSL